MLCERLRSSDLKIVQANLVDLHTFLQIDRNKQKGDEKWKEEPIDIWLEMRVFMVAQVTFYL